MAADNGTALNIVYPAILCKRGTLVVIKEEFFRGIGEYRQEDRTLEVALAKNVGGTLKWILDRFARLHTLNLLGAAPATIPQRIGLVPRRERYEISAPIEISSQELLGMIANLRDAHPEVPNVSDLERLLRVLPQKEKIQASDLRSYFGE